MDEQFNMVLEAAARKIWNIECRAIRTYDGVHVLRIDNADVVTGDHPASQNSSSFMRENLSLT